MAIDLTESCFAENASTGELKIVRMSECSAPCTGGTEVWMLVEKVKKCKSLLEFSVMYIRVSQIYLVWYIISVLNLYM